MEESLSARVKTAAIGLVLIAAVIAVGWPLLLPFLAGLVWIAAGELAGIFKNRGIRLNLPALRVGGVLFLLASLPQLGDVGHYTGVPWREITLGLVLFYILVYELFTDRDVERAAYSVFGFLYLPWTLGYALLLRYAPDGNVGAWTLTLPVIATFATDIGAFFVGTKWGRRKIAPEISPSKTLEGSLGGILSSFLALLVYTSLVHRAFPFGWVELLIVSFLISVAAQLGDLTESMLKRFTGVKDSGNLLPGHGGVLDRLDSLIFSLPVTYYLWELFGK